MIRDAIYQYLVIAPSIAFLLLKAVYRILLTLVPTVIVSGLVAICMYAVPNFVFAFFLTLALMLKLFPAPGSKVYLAAFTHHAMLIGILVTLLMLVAYISGEYVEIHPDS